jgi:UDP-3-O-[3-hydroxymyristoyl] glucosamine N-acyltransferase
MRLEKPVTLGFLAAHARARLEGDPETPVCGLASLELAGPDEMSFVRSKADHKRVLASRAGSLLVPEGMPPVGRPAIVSAAPDTALALIGEALAPGVVPRSCHGRPGVHPTAFVGEGVELGEGVAVGANAVVEAGARIGAHSAVMPCAYVGPRAVVGEDTVIHPGAILHWGVRVGSRCVIHSGAVIGSDGFGFAPQLDGSLKRIPQLGDVLIEDDVEIGACACVDRATMDSTVIGRGAKLDNLVHIAHNCRVGPGCAMAAQAGIAGSSVIGERVMLGGQAGVAGHVTVGDRARIGGGSAVIGNVPADGDYWGFPARERLGVLRELAALSRIRDLMKQVDDLAARVEALERASLRG